MMDDLTPKPIRRRSIRLGGYDYASPGAYFITLVAHQRLCLFGTIRDGEMELSTLGRIVEEKYQAIPGHLDNVELGEYVVMPNHVHGIIILHDVPRRGVVSTPANDSKKGDETSSLPIKLPTLGQVVAYYKYQSTKQVNSVMDSPGAQLWQRNYYDHIIRNDKEHARIYAYIASNPIHMEDDDENVRL